MIVYVNWFSSFKDYRQGLDEEKIRGELPANCPKCGQSKSFWKHGGYERQVKMPGNEKLPIQILRFICRTCSLTISCLYKFLVAYRHYAASVVATVVETYAREMTSYRELAWSQADGSACFASGFRWVSEMSRKSESLLGMVQREMVVTNLWQQDLPVEIACPNAGKAASEEKRICLDKLASVVATARHWFARAQKPLICLQEHMVAQAETCLSIMSAHKLRMSAPHNMQHLYF